nr:hypothetical protein [Amphibacillus jilinensis]
MFKILLIEDDATLFKEIKDRLVDWEYEVFEVKNFQSVMESFAEVHPDNMLQAWDCT